MSLKWTDTLDIAIELSDIHTPQLATRNTRQATVNCTSGNLKSNY